MLSSFKDLVVWQKSMDLAVQIYSLCKKLPIDEQFGISTQMKRSVVSISSNIAEGFKRGGPKEFRQFFIIAQGSAAELESQILLCQRIFQIEI